MEYRRRSLLSFWDGPPRNPHDISVWNDKKDTHKTSYTHLFVGLFAFLCVVYLFYLCKRVSL
uniref:Uncharacterized protein n=1 Tax=viral metagenome TaxID=1070528 RepID=A0A6C0KLN6_9ZZZZ